MGKENLSVVRIIGDEIYDFGPVDYVAFSLAILQFLLLGILGLLACINAMIPIYIVAAIFGLVAYIYNRRLDASPYPVHLCSLAQAQLAEKLYSQGKS